MTRRRLPVIDGTQVAIRLCDACVTAVSVVIPYLTTSAGRGRCGLILLIKMIGDDPDAMGRTRSRTRVPKGSASAALLLVCSGRCYILGRPRWVTATPEAVGTGSRRSFITEGIIGHDPVAMACTAGGVVGL